MLARGAENGARERIECYGSAVASIDIAVAECPIGARDPMLLVSDDGRRWSRIPGGIPPYGADPSPPRLSDFYLIEPWAGGLLAVGSGTDGRHAIWRSRDGADWQRAGDPLEVDGRVLLEDGDYLGGFIVHDGGLVVTHEDFVLVGRPG